MVDEVELGLIFLQGLELSPTSYHFSNVLYSYIINGPAEVAVPQNSPQSFK
jgi:hypothetical protein